MSKGSAQRKVNQERFDENFDRIFGGVKIMPLENIVEALKDRKLTVVARETDIHYNTIYSIASGKNLDPSYRVVKSLSEYLNQGVVTDGGHN